MSRLNDAFFHFIRAYNCKKVIVSIFILPAIINGCLRNPFTFFVTYLKYASGCCLWWQCWGKSVGLINEDSLPALQNPRDDQLISY